MPLLSFEPLTALRFVGFIYALMAATVWLLLGRRHRPVGLSYWCLGSSALAAGALLLGLRNVIPYGLSVHVAHLMIFASYSLRVVALRLDMKAPPRLGQAVAVAAMAMLVIAATELLSVSLRAQLSPLLQSLMAAWLAVVGLQAARITGLRPAAWIGGAYAAFAIALFVMFVGLISVADVPQVNTNHQPALLLVLLVGSAAGVYGNFGYIGMSMERLHDQELRQATALAREAALRSTAEQHAQQLQELLGERDNLVRVLAHEVRQPLNNASAALQSARTALAPVTDDRRTQPTAVEHRVQRAQSVLSQVIGSLDNTLAATALLASPDRVAQQDTDVDLLLQLSLGDLDATQALRVQVERLTQTRTATMDAGLMRLALRNLLNNALTYSDPGTPVVLRLSDSDEPLALVFEVIDSGPGVAPELAPRLFMRGARGDHEQPGHGLGLYVVLRVAELHDSRVEMQHREGGGSIFRLSLMQGRG